MPVISLNSDDPFTDGRQSERALQIRTGVERHFKQLNWVTLPEFTLATGRRADLIALSQKGDLCIIEIKSSVADLKSDNKWPEYREFCDQLLFATLPDVPTEIFPQEAGLMVADAYGAEILRTPEEHRLSAARRKSVHLSFARASAQRLERLCAHAGIENASLTDEN